MRRLPTGPVRTWRSWRGFAALLALVALGCSHIPTTRLEYDPAGTRVQPPPAVDVAVLPLEESRPPRHMPSLQGNLFKTYIPLLPYVRIPYERIDEHYILAEKEKGRESPSTEPFPVLFADAIAEDLRRSGLARSVLRVDTAAEAPPDALLLAGELRSTEFNYYATSYMLGMPGVLLWLLAIPMGSNAADIEFDLVLRTPHGEEIWRHRAEGRASRFFTLYNASGGAVSSQYRLEIKRYGGNDEGIDGDSLWAYHAAALREAMEPAKASLLEALRSHAGRSSR